uniref:Uncharacterized protein n=1 Tax=Ditylenchus dipsaci TaxID=166011 RepID=A0A915D3D9_9BILA
MSKQTPIFCINGEEFPDKGFRNRCVTRLKAAMQQNPQNTLVQQFSGDPFKAEEYYFDKSREQADSRSYYMTAITRALKHFKGPGPPFNPVPGLSNATQVVSTTAELGPPVEPAVVNQIQLRSSNKSSWHIQAFRDAAITKMQKEVDKDVETVNRLGFPSDAKHIESIVFALCEGSKSTYEKMLSQLMISLNSVPEIQSDAQRD